MSSSTLTPAATAALQSNTKMGSEIVSQVHYAEKYLKEKYPAPVGFHDLLQYLSLPVEMQKLTANIKRALLSNPHVTHTPKHESPSGKETFEYRPTHPVTNAEELKTYLARQPTAAGLQVKDLKDGWPDCTPALLSLAASHEVLLTYNKKDNTPRTVYADSPHLHPPAKISQEFVDFWGKCKVPANETDVRAVLEEAGITPTSAVREVRKANMQRKEKRKVSRRGGKVTNLHMGGILREYKK